MESLLISLNVVIPMGLMLLIGWLLKENKVIAHDGFDALNTLCFKLLLPISLFCNIYESASSTVIRPQLILAAIACQVAILGGLALTVPRLFPKNQTRASLIQACFRANFITFGLPIAEQFCSADDIAVVSVLAGVMIPIFNIGGVAILEYFRGGKMKLRTTVKKIVTNPFVLCSVLALMLRALNIHLPQSVQKAASNLASCAVPISFIALGGCLNFGKLRSYIPELSFGVIWRLLVQPLVLLPLLYLAGFRGVEFLALTVMLISPTAVATYNMASSMDADGELAGQLVFAQSIMSVFTIFLWIAFLDGMSLL